MAERSNLWRKDLPIAGPQVPWNICVALNRLQGVEPIRKFGRNADVNGTYEDIWDFGGVYTFPAAAQTLDIVSSDANDTSAGTGARTVTVTGLDANYIEVEETVSLSGLTPVTTTQTFLRVHRCFAVTAGSNGTNIGNLDVTQTTSGTRVAYVSAGLGSTLQLIYTVPAGKYIHLEILDVAVDDGDRVEYTLERRLFGGAWQTVLIKVLAGSAHRDHLEHGLIFPEKTDIRIRATKLAGTNGRVSAEIEGLLFEDSWYNAT